MGSLEEGFGLRAMLAMSSSISYGRVSFMLIISLSSPDNLAQMDHWSFAFLVSGMLRNIPNKVDQPLLKRIVDSSFYGKYDFMYLRIDFANDYNVGYAFINFVKAEYIVDFVQPLGHRRRMTTSKGMAFFGARHVETDGSYVYVCFEDLRGITNFHDVFEQACTSGISRRLELCDTPTPDIEEVQAFTEDLQARGMIFGARHVETDGSHVYVCFEDLRGIINFHNAFEQACKIVFSREDS
ncbi:hypothetical protein FVEN_g1261 [Fusarium venenatum]|nr:hypothetical protein FVEN_g1261 [Fusarium venenatum]